MIMITNGVITHVNITDYPKKLDMIWYDAKNNQLIVCKSLPYADKDQKCFPSQKLIARELNLNERTVMSKIKVLIRHRLIAVTRMKNKQGKWINNVYTLLDKSMWEKSPTYIKDTGGKTTYINSTKPPTSKLQYKDTHIKDTHIKKEIYKERKLNSLEEITEKDLIEIAKQYKVSLGFVKLQFEKMKNWLLSSGKRKKDYKATLRNFVLGDMQRTIESRQKKGGFVDATQI